MYFCEAGYNVLKTDSEWRVKRVIVNKNTWDFISEQYPSIKFDHTATDLATVREFNYVAW